MSNDDEKIVRVATNFIISILSYEEITMDGFLDLCKIKNGDKKVLLEHLKAVNNITGKAIKILEGNKDDK